MEMGRIVFAEIHVNEYSVKVAYLWHIMSPLYILYHKYNDFKVHIHIDLQFYSKFFWNPPYLIIFMRLILSPISTWISVDAITPHYQPYRHHGFRDYHIRKKHLRFGCKCLIFSDSESAPEPGLEPGTL